MGWGPLGSNLSTGLPPSSSLLLDCRAAWPRGPAAFTSLLEVLCLQTDSQKKPFLALVVPVRYFITMTRKAMSMDLCHVHP